MRNFLSPYLFFFFFFYFYFLVLNFRWSFLFSFFLFFFFFRSKVPFEFNEVCTATRVNWSRQLRVGVKMKRCTSRSTSRRKWNISFFEVFYDLFVPHFFFLSTSWSAYFSRILLFSMIFRSGYESSRDWKSLVHFVRNWRAGLSKVEWNRNGPMSFRSFWIVCVLFDQASLSFQLFSRKDFPNSSEL